MVKIWSQETHMYPLLCPFQLLAVTLLGLLAPLALATTPVPDHDLINSRFKYYLTITTFLLPVKIVAHHQEQVKCCICIFNTSTSQAPTIYLVIFSSLLHKSSWIKVINYPHTSMSMFSNWWYVYLYERVLVANKKTISKLKRLPSADLSQENQALLKRLETMEKTMGDLSRQVMLQQLYVEERIRSDGSSGIKQVPDHFFLLKYKSIIVKNRYVNVLYIHPNNKLPSITQLTFSINKLDN